MLSESTVFRGTEPLGRDLTSFGQAFDGRFGGRVATAGAGREQTHATDGFRPSPAVAPRKKRKFDRGQFDAFGY